MSAASGEPTWPKVTAGSIKDTLEAALGSLELVRMGLADLDRQEIADEASDLLLHARSIIDRVWVLVCTDPENAA